ncbi:hypothetical protein [Chitinophaga niabensis]|uniref:Lipocalin-like domain-containing protein n=1 Tax=Chitinophaga niabensis TaxID=536979 RepID=A0A1N6J8G0_9BACT|nr:hypothetical protein [Chitinophaga niabensis]SIO40658.1 hypothetical protein SAMN04488055_3748 [Chitinophaga niabensis]
MKKIYYLALSALLFAACSKDEKEAPPQPRVNNTIYGQWDLLATTQPFSADTAWKYIRRAEDLTSLLLFENKNYISYKHPDKQIRGSFTVSDSAGTNIKKVTLSNEGEPITLYLQLFESGLLKVDDETVKNEAPGYVSKRFGRRVFCTILQ